MAIILSVLLIPLEMKQYFLIIIISNKNYLNDINSNFNMNSASINRK
eukprot:UN01590